MKTIIILIVCLTFVSLALGFCIFVMIKTNGKLKQTEMLLNVTTQSLVKATQYMQDGIEQSLKDLKTRIESVVIKSKEEFNNNSSSSENTLINGGFKKVNK
ncbi:MAG: hypothetical protein IJ772_05090 [Bacilli bacterium]|nr:hypothetical protein [Bacilli bacterium]